MRSKLALLFFATAISLQSFGQYPTISTVRLGDLKPGLELDSINKFLDVKIKVKPLKKIDETSADSANIVYKGLKVMLVLYKYIDGKKMTAYLTNIYSEDANLTTKSGIKMGDNKFDLIKKLDGSTLNVSLNYLKADPKYSMVTLYDNQSGSSLTFYFLNNLLYAFETGSSEEGC